jgi:hypothetical protein
MVQRDGGDRLCIGDRVPGSGTILHHGGASGWLEEVLFFVLSHGDGLDKMVWENYGACA